VDLCAGVGDSTEVLARCLPRGSDVLGLECNPEFVLTARSRIYRDGAGNPVKTEFRVQSVLEPFRDSSGMRLPDASVDLVNCCGALAINFNTREISVLAAEIARVVRAGGLAAIDSPASRAGKERMVRVFSRHHFVALGSAQSCFLDRFSQICFRRRDGARQHG
jgi:SAM-dependent methyltransferase